MTASALARKLRVPPQRPHEIVRGNRAISPGTALRLARHFGNEPEFWPNLQVQYDLAQARETEGRGSNERWTWRAEWIALPRGSNAGAPLGDRSWWERFRRHGHRDTHAPRRRRTSRKARLYHGEHREPRRATEKKDIGRFARLPDRTPARSAILSLYFSVVLSGPPRSPW